MPVGLYLVPVVDDGTGTMIAKYSNNPNLDRVNVLLLSESETDVLVPLIADREGVTEQQVRNQLPNGRVAMARVVADQSLLNQAENQSDVLPITVDEAVKLLNFRYGVTRTKAEWIELFKDKAEKGEAKEWKPPKRNIQGVKHQAVRERVDDISGQLHDDLTDVYYRGGDYVLNGINYGSLTQPEFTLIHGYFSTHLPMALFHQANIELSNNGHITKVPESEYRFQDDPDGQIDRYQEALDAKAELVDKGFDLDFTFTHPDFGTINV